MHKSKMKIFLLVVVCLAGLSVGVHAAIVRSSGDKTDKIDPVKALKISRDVARLAEARAKIEQLGAMVAQLNRDIAPTGDELRELCKEAKLELDDVLSGCAGVKDDGTVVRRVTVTKPNGEKVCEDAKPAQAEVKTEKKAVAKP